MRHAGEIQAAESDPAGSTSSEHARGTSGHRVPSVLGAQARLCAAVPRRPPQPSRVIDSRRVATGHPLARREGRSVTTRVKGASRLYESSRWLPLDPLRSVALALPIEGMPSGSRRPAEQPTSDLPRSDLRAVDRDEPAVGERVQAIEQRDHRLEVLEVGERDRAPLTVVDSHDLPEHPKSPGRQWPTPTPHRAPGARQRPQRPAERRTPPRWTQAPSRRHRAPQRAAGRRSRASDERARAADGTSREFSGQ